MTESLPFALLRPVPAERIWVPEIDPADVLVGATVDDVRQLLGDSCDADVVAVDVETRGTDTWKPTTAIVGVGVAWRHGDQYGARYFDIGSMSEVAATALFSYVAQRSCRQSVGHWVNHNVHFDYALWQMELRRRGIVDTCLWYTHCTYGLYKQLAGEGFPSQTWGLKSAAVQLLGWPARHDIELDEWLIAHGYHGKGPKPQEGETPELHLAACRVWESTPTSAGNARSRVAADKSQMWRAPADLLGRYCLLDCFATLQLYDWVLRPVLDQFPELERFHCEYWIPQTRLLAEQQYAGIRVDRPRLEARAAQLRAEIDAHAAEARACPVLGPSITAIEAVRLQTERDAHAAKEPADKLKAPRQRKEPKKYTRDGALSRKWIYWDLQLRNPPQEQTAAYRNWIAKRSALEAKCAPERGWKPTSDADVRELLFDSGLVPYEMLPKSDRYRGPGEFAIYGVNGRVELELTDAGLLSVDSATLGQLPDWAEPLRRLKKKQKELSYAESYLDLLYWHADPSGPDRRDVTSDERGTWRLHPGWIMDGTKTLRLAGTNPNLAQVPKSLEFLECFLADVATDWIEFDFTAIEPHVLAEMSQDAALLKLYGPGAKPHDRYLFSCASYPGVVGDRVRQFYSVDNPTEESTSKAKKECKPERELGKVFVLSGDYGAGWRKQQKQARLRGVPLTDAEAQSLNQAHKKLHADVYEKFGPALEAEWRRRGGWFYSGLGHPICVWEGALKDCINRDVQSTAHKLLVMMTIYMARRMQEECIPVTGIVWDYHDQAVVQVRSDTAERAKQIVEESVEWLNTEIQSTVRLKAEPQVVRSLGAAKMAEAWEKKYGSPVSS